MAFDLRLLQQRQTKATDFVLQTSNCTANCYHYDTSVDACDASKTVRWSAASLKTDIIAVVSAHGSERRVSCPRLSDSSIAGAYQLPLGHELSPITIKLYKCVFPPHARPQNRLTLAEDVEAEACQILYVYFKVQDGPADLTSRVEAREAIMAALKPLAARTDKTLNLCEDDVPSGYSATSPSKGKSGSLFTASSDQHSADKPSSSPPKANSPGAEIEPTSEAGADLFPIISDSPVTNPFARPTGERNVFDNSCPNDTSRLSYPFVQKLLGKKKQPSSDPALLSSPPIIREAISADEPASDQDLAEMEAEVDEHLTDEDVDDLEDEEDIDMKGSCSFKSESLSPSAKTERSATESAKADEVDDERFCSCTNCKPIRQWQNQAQFKSEESPNQMLHSPAKSTKQDHSTSTGSGKSISKSAESSKSESVENDDQDENESSDSDKENADNEEDDEGGAYDQEGLPTGRPDALRGLTFTFAGELPHLDRSTASELVKRFGGRVVSSPTQKTHYAVVGCNPSKNRLTKIQSLPKLQIIDQAGLYVLIQTRRPPSPAVIGQAFAPPVQRPDALSFEERIGMLIADKCRSRIALLKEQYQEAEIAGLESIKVAKLREKHTAQLELVEIEYENAVKSLKRKALDQEDSDRQQKRVCL